MSRSTSTIQLTGLAKGKLAMLRRHAKSMGISAEEYAKKLLEDAIEIDERARTQTFDQMFAGVQADYKRSGMTEDDLGHLVESARTRYAQRIGVKRRRKG